MPSSLQEILLNSGFRFRLDNAQFSREGQLMNHRFWSPLAYFVRFLFAVTSVTLQTLSVKLCPLARTLVPRTPSWSESEKRAVKKQVSNGFVRYPLVLGVLGIHAWKKFSEKDSHSCPTRQLHVLLHCRHVHGSLFCPCHVLPCLQSIIVP